MQAIIALIKREPALTGGVVTALLALAAAFGLHVSDLQAGALQGGISAVVALAAAFGVRAEVTPVAPRVVSP
jgi:diacylglycerol kinase